MKLVFDKTYDDSVIIIENDNNSPKSLKNMSFYKKR